MTSHDRTHTVTSEKGFTLLEIIVSLIVASILGAMLMAYVGTAYNKSVTPVITSKRIMRLEQAMEDINVIYAGLLNQNNILQTLNSRISAMTFPTGVTFSSSKQFDFLPNGTEPSSSDGTGGVLKVVLSDTTIDPKLELISYFYQSR